MVTAHINGLWVTYAYDHTSRRLLAGSPADAVTPHTCRGANMPRHWQILLMCVATAVAVGGCASRQTNDPPDLEERSSARSMLTIYYLQIKKALTPQ